MNRSRKNHGRGLIAVLALVIGLLLPTTPPPAQAQGNLNPGVLPPNSRAFGKTYGEWGAKWWQWVFSVPAPINPNLDPTGENCGQGQAGPVWFIAGNFGGAFTRTCKVPPGKALFFPILNTAFGAGVFDCEPTNPDVVCDVNTLLAAAAATQDNPILLEVSVDGVPLQNLTAYRAHSSAFSITFPEDAVFGLPVGTFTPNVADGYWLLLAPLPVGTHTIHSIGIANNGFVAEATTNLIIGH